MDELVRRLSEDSHPVALTLRPEATVRELKDCIERKYVHVKFTGTRGGTELGVRLDSGATDLSRANFDAQSGTIRLVGDLVLNDVPVRCVADVNLATFDGVGSLQPIAG
jgi:hypothetical protein